MNPHTSGAILIAAFLTSSRRRLMIVVPEFNSYLNERPFRPFRIHMASGDTFEVRHPEMVHLGRNNLRLYTHVSNLPENHDRWDTISLMLMERLSHI